MSKYRVKESFSYADSKAPDSPQEVSYEAGAEIELDDAKAAEIGLSYLEKVEDSSSKLNLPADSPKGDQAGGSESHTDTSSQEGGTDGEGQ